MNCFRNLAVWFYELLMVCSQNNLFGSFLLIFFPFFSEFQKIEQTLKLGLVVKKFKRYMQKKKKIKVGAPPLPFPVTPSHHGISNNIQTWYNVAKYHIVLHIFVPQKNNGLLRN